MDAKTLLYSWRRPAECAAAGRKARGLLALPVGWVPPFVALGAGLATEVERRGARKVLRELPGGTREELEGRLLAGCEHLVIRSDGPEEGSVPGAGLSVVCEASWEALEEALEEYRERGDGIGLPLLQVGVEPGLLGVMSNARELSARPDSWIVEGILGTDAPQARRIRSARPRRHGHSLAARSRAALLARLREAAALLQAGGGRVRSEWVWDGARLWIVQADRSAEPEGDREASLYLAGREREGTVVSRSGPRRRSRFAKLRSRGEFEQLGMSLVPAVEINGEAWKQRRGRKRWIEEVVGTSGRPFVVRSDLAGRSAPFLLPTSEPLSDPGRIAGFIDRCLGRLEAEGRAAEDVLFLVSPLVAARASALVYADAKRDGTRVDALWGFPDGLLNLPHDSFECAEGRPIVREIRYKPAALLLAEGRAERVRLGPPFDWDPCLRADEVRRLAEWGRRLSESRSVPVALMALCRIGGRRGPSACLPFHVWEETSKGAGVRQVAPQMEMTISARRDLRRHVPPGSSVRVELEERVERDVGLIEAVGRWAVKNKATLIFSGSLLGHTRAVLERSGALVVSPEDAEIDWSGYRPALVRVSAGLARVRMVAAKELGSRRAERSPFRGIPDLTRHGDVKPLGGDLPGQPGLFMDDSLVGTH